MMGILFRLIPHFSCMAVILLGCCLRADERDSRNGHIARQLVQILRDNSGRTTPQARVAAARTLGKMGLDARDVIPELIQILSDSNRRYPLLVDEALVEAVGRLGVPARDAIPALLRNTGYDRDLDRAIRESVDTILAAPQIQTQLAVLIARLKDSDPAERLRAAKALAAFGTDGKPAIPALTRALNDRDPDVRRQALRALEAIQIRVEASDAVLGVYISDLTDTDEAIRLRAAKALGRYGPAAKAALPVLTEASRNDPDADVRRVAADAIARIQGNQANPE